jgi:hypothetical protein
MHAGYTAAGAWVISISVRGVKQQAMFIVTARETRVRDNDDMLMLSAFLQQEPLHVC